MRTSVPLDMYVLAHKRRKAVSSNIRRTATLSFPHSCVKPFPPPPFSLSFFSPLQPRTHPSSHFTFISFFIYLISRSSHSSFLKSLLLSSTVINHPFFPITKRALQSSRQQVMVNIPMTSMQSDHTEAPISASNHESFDIENHAATAIKITPTEPPRPVHGWRWGLAGK